MYPSRRAADWRETIDPVTGRGYTHRRSWFVEWEANLPERGGSRHWLNGGFHWLQSDKVQFDLNAGVGLNDRTGDYRFGIGFSIRP